jgi:hypothetical protein
VFFSPLPGSDRRTQDDPPIHGSIHPSIQKHRLNVARKRLSLLRLKRFVSRRVLTVSY